ncbi:UNVERIFIED_CONTAM: hypothetical protein Sradi_2985600 [Sesamum radiatum]|uniref:Uncharacterized protein n=1 Tax=Sesamum radiatum TaxID=300843 RepID=A0AAW2S0M8_SESRA
MMGMPCGIIARCRQIEWASNLRCDPTPTRHRGRLRRRRGPTMQRVVGHETGVAAHAELCNAEAERGCSLTSKDALAGSEIVRETYGGRLASQGRPQKRR